jgi:putative ABC transport system permease protein
VAITGGNEIVNRANLYVGVFDWDGRNPDVKNEVNFIPIGSNLNELENLELKQGRWFLPGRKNDGKNFVLNETAVRELGIREPVIGQRFTNGQDTGKVIGVVKDFHYLGLHERIGPMVFGNDPFYANSFLVKSRPGKQADALIATEKVWKHFNPDQPFDYQFATDQFERLYRTELKAASLIPVFSILAIFISCLGLYALASFSAERRRKEVGIRKVLGASVTGIVGILTTDFAKLVLIAMLIASPLGWWAMNKWLQTFAYHIDIQWWIFALAGILALLIAFVTISFHAAKAAMMNPVKSLRRE